MSREIGRHWERFVGEYLLKIGYRVIEYNYFCKFGEIDIIAIDEEMMELLFVEVKFRTSEDFGNSYEFVGHSKIHKLEKAISCYLIQCERTNRCVKGIKLSDMDYRLDVLSIHVERDREGNENIALNHFENVSF